MRRILCLLALSAPCSGLATPVTMQFRLTVRPACERWTATADTLTLRCTRDYHPADPRALPELQGQLPPGEWTLRDSSAAPTGGTLNTYVLTPGSGAAPTDFY
ncbi:hypothetical protein [Deinococcus radiotolerans]|uniref:Uncharacterized protein n=1 Tax=Deinococcus radiotolerans TaxID=1309407 RepID=A0ABQ2FF28_9DEIO|nr:hypothetical protein [Deinococcus radiotolerans]GGK88077.1 hypothetical protein GCM10010844_03350 [Deinococcus radiotolerans]